MISTRQKGNIGEDIACKYLTGKGFRIVCRNYLKKWGEIDIVCEKGNIVHFVEVKSISGEWGIRTIGNNTDDHRPEENVHALKLKHLGRVIESYLWEFHKGQDTPFQVHVVCVYSSNNIYSAKVKMIENIII